MQEDGGPVLPVGSGSARRSWPQHRRRLGRSRPCAPETQVSLYSLRPLSPSSPGEGSTVSSATAAGERTLRTEKAWACRRVVWGPAQPRVLPRWGLLEQGQLRVRAGLRGLLGGGLLRLLGAHAGTFQCKVPGRTEPRSRAVKPRDAGSLWLQRSRLQGCEPRSGESSQSQDLPSRHGACGHLV